MSEEQRLKKIEYKRKWYEKNKDRVKEYSKMYYEENRDNWHKYYESRKEYIKKYNQERKEYHKQYREEHKEEFKRANLKFRETHNWSEYCSNSRKKRAEKLREQGILNPYVVINKEGKAKYKKENYDI